MNLYDTLKENNYALIASNGYFSKENGIKPIINKMNENLLFFDGLVVADKIVGKASAMLLCLSKVKELYCGVLSISGMEILKKHHIKYHYETLTDYIINRKGDDMCPMEKTVKDIEDLNEAYIVLKQKVSSL